MNGIFGRAALAGLMAACATFVQAALPPDFAGLPRVEPETALHVEDGGGPKARALSKRASKKLDVQLAPPTGLELGQVRREAKEGTPLQIGFPRDVDTLADETKVHTRIEWEAFANGGLLGAVQITSPTAAALRVGLRVQSLPPAAVLRFLSPEGEELFEVSGQEILDTIARNRAAGDHGIEGREFWSPVIDAATLVMEVELPAGSKPSDFRVGLPRISHLVASAKDDFAMAKAAASCTIDAMCSGREAWSNQHNSVARMVFSSGGSSFLCTGTLLADGDASTTIPYFITANHCIGSQTVASTLVTYWFYRTASCGGGAGAYVTRSGGATLLHASIRSDAAFMRLNTAPPAGAVYAGWIAGTPPALDSRITGLHHPTGDYLRISYGNIVAYANCGTGQTFSCAASSVSNTQYYAVRWFAGITQGGSSGSGLFLDDGKYLIGTLYGGSSSCSTPSSADFYGRFDISYNEVIHQWLGAAASGTQAATTTTVTASVNPSQAGQSVYFTARVESAFNAPHGNVMFEANGVPISGCAARPLFPNGQTWSSVDCTTSQLPHGNSTIVARYLGNDVYAPSASPSLTQGVLGVSTLLSLTSSATPVMQGDAVTLTATISGGSGAAGGTVAFRDEGNLIPGCGAVPVATRTATCVTSAIGLGRRGLTARYSGDWRLLPSNSPSLDQVVMAPPPPGKRGPQVGDFDGDGRSDILWLLADGSVSMWRMNGTAVTAADAITAPLSGMYVDGVGESNSDGRSDIFFGNSDGRLDVWFMAGPVTTATLSLLSVGSGGASQQLADFDGDGRTDALLKHSDGSVQMRLVTTGATRTLLAAGSPFSAALAGDFNGDGRADIVWRHPDGRIILWLMNGLDLVQSRTLYVAGSTSVPVFARDFDGDGKADLVVEHGDGSSTLLRMNGVDVASSHPLQFTGSVWRAVHVGDFNGDGKADLLWRNATYGNVVMWLMNGFTYTASRTLRTANTTWTAARLGDFNGDGRSDILWTSNTGGAEIWLMDGVNATTQAAADPSNPVISVPGASTWTAVGFPPTAMMAGQPATFTATVGSDAGTPTGTVSFGVDGSTVGGCGAVPLSAGTAACTTPPLRGGTHTVAVTYHGAPGFSGSATQTLFPVQRVATATAIAGPATSVAGTWPTFTATVTGGTGSFTAPLVFVVDGQAWGACALTPVGGSASCTMVGIAAGSHTIHAVYDGDQDNLVSVAPAIAHTVDPAPPGPPPAALARTGVDFDGDGNEDILWHHPGTLATKMWRFPASGMVETTLLAGGSGRSAQLVGDFDGDGKSDILFRVIDGTYELWIMDGATRTALHVLRAAASGWEAQRSGDFNGDGRADIAWKHSDGRVEITLMNGGTVLETRQLQGAGSPFNVARTADLNADGKSDILWAAADGRVIAWLMDGTSFIASRTLQALGGTGSVVHAGDLNGDGKADLVWEYTDGSTTLALMDGVNVLSSRAAQAPGSAWRVTRLADLNDDGKQDIAWRNVTYGNVVTWLMDGVNYTASRTQRGANTDWMLATAGDYSGEGSADLLWLSVLGNTELWLMNGLEPGALKPGVVGQGWRVVQ